MQKLKQQKEEAVVVRKRKISKIKADDDDYLTKQHPDILAEALKHKFQFKFNKEDEVHVQTSKEKDSRSNDSDKEIEEESKSDDESVSSEKIKEVFNNNESKAKYKVRINDTEYILYCVLHYLIYFKEGYENNKQGFKINNYVEIMSNKKTINSKFRGLVILKDTRTIVTNPVAELEVCFSKESEYNDFLNLVDQI